MRTDVLFFFYLVNLYCEFVPVIPLVSPSTCAVTTADLTGWGCVYTFFYTHFLSFSVIPTRYYSSLKVFQLLLLCFFGWHQPQFLTLGRKIWGSKILTIKGIKGVGQWDKGRALLSHARRDLHNTAHPSFLPIFSQRRRAAMDPFSQLIFAISVTSFVIFQWLFHKGSPWVSTLISPGFLGLSDKQKVEWNSRWPQTSLTTMHLSRDAPNRSTRAQIFRSATSWIGALVGWGWMPPSQTMTGWSWCIICLQKCTLP